MPKQKCEITATFTCQICKAQATTSYTTEAAPKAEITVPELPADWKYSHGASGCGQYYQCKKCSNVLIDDSKGSLCYDYSYHDDLRAHMAKLYAAYQSTKLTQSPSQHPTQEINMPVETSKQLSEEQFETVLKSDKKRAVKILAEKVAESPELKQIWINNQLDGVPPMINWEDDHLRAAARDYFDWKVG